MSELKLCPICGSEAVYTTEYGYTKNGLVETDWCSCDDIRCMPEGVVFDVKRWNTRPIEDDLRKQLEIARKALRNCGLLAVGYRENLDVVMVANAALAQLGAITKSEGE